MVIAMKTVKEGKSDWSGGCVRKGVGEGLSWQVPFELSSAWCKWVRWGRCGRRAFQVDDMSVQRPEAVRGLRSGGSEAGC